MTDLPPDTPPSDNDAADPQQGRATQTDHETNLDTSKTAINLILADLAILAGSTLVRKGVERSLLGGEPLDQAEQEPATTEGRGKRIAAKVGTLASKSAPAAAAVATFVTGGMVVKNLFDRSQRVRERKYGSPTAKPVEPDDKA